MAGLLLFVYACGKFAKNHCSSSVKWNCRSPLAYSGLASRLSPVGLTSVSLFNHLASQLTSSRTAAVAPGENPSNSAWNDSASLSSVSGFSTGLVQVGTVSSVAVVSELELILLVVAGWSLLFTATFGVVIPDTNAISKVEVCIWQYA